MDNLINKKTIGDDVKEMIEWAKDAYPKFEDEYGTDHARALVKHDAAVMMVIGKMALEEMDKLYPEPEKEAKK